MTSDSVAGKGFAVWRLKNGADRRFRAGHPWVYSNELEGSPKGVAAGDPVELRDAQGKFLARGFGNPSSLIAFRALSRVPSDETPWAPQAIFDRLMSAFRLRQNLGLTAYSYRLCFGEVDGIPGLVIDRYLTGEGREQVFSIQAHSAGADRMLGFLPEVLKGLVEKSGGPGWEKTALVLRNDVAVRKLEGLVDEAPRVLKPNGADLAKSKISVRPATQSPAASQADDSLYFHVDLMEGQKTGFFLDQGGNIALAAAQFRGLRPKKILDLCCYAGQWGAQFARIARLADDAVEVTGVDASSAALDLARQNVEAQGAKFVGLKADVLHELQTSNLAEKSFDLVICDPPALIKGRKDIPQGKHAYLQINTQAFRLVKPGGAIVTCSCSALLEEEDFSNAVTKAAHRNGVSVRFVARGGQAPDHPFLGEFPEGRYLKCWVGLT